ncbi:MAG: hypothetical protein VKM17_08890 [Cyanobacteriota bacterium]|nr:hypothetical protein [Cyanobacteriota bacterium]
MEVARTGVPLPKARRRSRIPASLALMVLLGMGLGLGQPGRGEPKRYDPDRDTCQVQAIRRAYQANMLPWADQPEAVQLRLRQLQAAMTLDTLRDCQARGLLGADQAASLETELRLRSPSPSPPVTSEASQSPTRP